MEPREDGETKQRKTGVSQPFLLQLSNSSDNSVMSENAEKKVVRRKCIILVGGEGVRNISRLKKLSSMVTG